MVHLLGVIRAHRLLALACTHSCSRRVRLLCLSLVLQQLLVQEVVCVWSHELVREAVLHAHLLVGLVEVLLRPLLLHIGCMLLLLLL